MKIEFTNERSDRIVLQMAEQTSIDNVDGVVIEINSIDAKIRNALTLTRTEAEMLLQMLGCHLSPTPCITLKNGYVPLYDQTKDVPPEEYKSSMRDVFVVAYNHNERFPFISAVLMCPELSKRMFSNLCDLFQTPEELQYLEKVFAARLNEGVTITDMFDNIPAARIGVFDPMPPHTAKDCTYVLSRQIINHVTLARLYEHDIPIPFNVIMIPKSDDMIGVDKCCMTMYDCHLLPRWKHVSESGILIGPSERKEHDYINLPGVGDIVSRGRRVGRTTFLIDMLHVLETSKRNITEELD